MGQIDDFSKGLIPLRYSIYEERKMGISRKGILIALAYCVPFIAGALVSTFINNLLGILVGVIPLLIMIFKEKISWETKKLGFLEINDSELKIRKEHNNKIIHLNEIKKIEYIHCITRKSSFPITYNVTINLRSGQEYRLHIDNNADIPERPKHFYSTPPNLDSTFKLLKTNFKINVRYCGI